MWSWALQTVETKWPAPATACVAVGKRQTWTAPFVPGHAAGPSRESRHSGGSAATLKPRTLPRTMALGRDQFAERSLHPRDHSVT